MRFVNIELFLIANTALNREEVSKWLASLGAKEYQLPEGASDPSTLISLAGRRCYNSFEPGLNPNITKIRKELSEYLDNILRSGHGSVLEHASYTFAIENVSRVFTAEMNRHRVGTAISEASMRYIRYRDIPMWLPSCIRLTEEESEIWQMFEADPIAVVPEAQGAFRTARKKMETQRLIRTTVEHIESAYRGLQEIWKDELAEKSSFKDKKHVTSMIRRIIPLGVATGGVWTLNIRSLRHVLTARNSAGAEEEIVLVASKALKLMRDKEPMLFGDFKQVDGFWVPEYVKV